MKPRIRLGYADFWPGFDPEHDYFTCLLRESYNVEICDRPDFLIYSVFGYEHLWHSCVRIFYTGENIRPDFRYCDYAFTFDHLDRPEHYRLPYYARRIAGVDMTKRDVDVARVLAEKRRFCSFVYSDPTGLQRNRLLRSLAHYKTVDSGGRYRNNVGGAVTDKHAFLKESKFSIAFEHTCYPGYTTEKITDAMLAWAVPIYWGNPLVHLDFNPRSFINAHEFPDHEALIERIIEVDGDDDLYAEYIRQPWFTDNHSNSYIQSQHILAQFEKIFSTTITPVALRRRHWRLWDRHGHSLLDSGCRRLGRYPRVCLKRLRGK